MIREEFQKLHGFDDQMMDYLTVFKDTFSGRNIKVAGQNEGRWIPVPERRNDAKSLRSVQRS